jgi:hypothetical protein
MSESPLPSLGPIIEAVYQAISHWWPRSSDEARGELAFAITNDVLHAGYVEGEIWMMFVPIDDAYFLDPVSSVVDRIYNAVRDWFPHRRAADRRELALYIAVDVLRVRHLVGEIWTANVPTSVPADEELDQ